MVFLDVRGRLRKQEGHFFVLHILSLPPAHLLRHSFSTRQTPSVVAARCHLPQRGRHSGPFLEGAVAEGDWGSFKNSGTPAGRQGSLQSRRCTRQGRYNPAFRSAAPSGGCGRRRPGSSGIPWPWPARPRGGRPR